VGVETKKATDEKEVEVGTAKAAMVAKSTADVVAEMVVKAMAESKQEQEQRTGCVWQL
jgi:hypothetical protein